MVDLPTLYPDANILSMLFYKGGFGSTLAQHLKTKEWWAIERHNYMIYSSSVLESELMRGEYAQQKHAVAAVRRLPYLPMSKSVREYAQFLIESRLLPPAEYSDALISP